MIYAITNIISFIAYGIDKSKARRNRWRIPESILLLLSALGGFGALLGMSVFHHKTKKLKFKILVPLLCVLQVILIFYLRNRGVI